eukprot:764781-Hanusia_phi.AAC.2
MEYVKSLLMGEREQAPSHGCESVANAPPPPPGPPGTTVRLGFHRSRSPSPAVSLTSLLEQGLGPSVAAHPSRAAPHAAWLGGGEREGIEERRDRGERRRERG